MFEKIKVKNYLYFYPKDNIPDCTTEAFSFRDNYEEIEKLCAKIIGVNADDIENHKKICES
ncbi:MAG: redoxin domain-containing protein [Candidatus Aenigmatarchaeota archaeon]